MKKNTVDYLQRAAKYPDIHTAEQIAATARDLEGMKYHPVLLVDTPNFLTMTSTDLLNEVTRLTKMTQPDWAEAGCPPSVSYQDFRAKHIGLLFYHYALLYRLRSGEAKAWDEVNALYEDD